MSKRNLIKEASFQQLRTTIFPRVQHTNTQPTCIHITNLSKLLVHSKLENKQTAAMTSQSISNMRTITGIRGCEHMKLHSYDLQRVRLLAYSVVLAILTGPGFPASQFKIFPSTWHLRSLFFSCSRKCYLDCWPLDATQCQKSFLGPSKYYVLTVHFPMPKSLHIFYKTNTTAMLQDINTNRILQNE